MQEIFSNLLNTESFIPHGHCYLWKPGLVWLHLLSDALIAIAYYSIPITLVYFVRKRQDLPFNWIFLLFGAFIVACGTTHIMDVWTLWHPTYWLSGALKAITMLISVSTAILLVPLTPKALALPSPAQLEIANQELAHEVNQRQHAEEALRQVNEQLESRVEERTAELLRSETQLRQANESLESRVADRTVELQQTNDRLQQELFKREQAERQLQQTLTLQNAILNSANYSIISTTVDGTITSFNAGAEKMLGYTAAELVGKVSPAILHDPQEVVAQAQLLSQALGVEMAPGFEVFVAKAKRGEVEECEWTYQRKDGSRFPVLLSVTALRDRDDNVTGFVGIGSDITARKQAEASLAHLAAIVKYSGDAIISKTLDGIILSWNETAEKIFGYGAEEIVGQSITRLIPSTLLYEEQQILETIRRGETIQQYETTRLRKDGQTIHVSVTVSPLKDSAGNIIGASATKRDISDRKQAENERKRVEIALRNSEEQFRHAFEDASIGMAIVSLDGHWLKANSALCRIIDYTVDELLPLTFQDITHPDDLEADLDYVNQLLAGDIPTYQLEKRYFHKQRHIVWVLLNASLVRDEQGNPLHFIAQIQDITTRKQIEAALQENEARYRAIVEDQTELICRFLPDSTILFANDAYCRYFGLHLDEVIGKSYQPVIFADDQEKVVQLVSSMNRDHPTVMIENRVILNGQLRWTQWSNRMIFNEHGDFIEYQAVGRDVTELKRVELERQAVSDRLNFLLNYSPVVIFSSKPDGDYGATFISENIQDVLGYDASAFLADSHFWANHLHPDDVERVFDGLANLFVDDFYTHEYRLRRSDGIYCWLLAQLRLIRDQAGRPLEILGYLVDISDRKQIEAQLQKSEANLLEAQRVAHVGSWELDFTTQQLIWSEELLRMFGFESAAPKPGYAEHLNYIHPDDRDLLQTCIMQATERGTPYAVDLRFFRSNGTMGYMEAKGRAVQNEHGQVVRLFGTALDISDRKRIEAERQQVEAALRESESRFQAFMDHSPAAAWITDANGTMLYASETYCRTFQVPTTNLIGRSVFDLFPLEIAQQFLANIQAVAQSQQVIETVEIAPRADGTAGDFLVYKFSVPDGLERVLVGGVAIDITLQHRAEIALQKSEERLQLALEASGDGLWDWNIATGEVYYSPQFMTMLGYDADELPRNLETWKYLTHPDDQAWVLDILNAHMQDNSVPYSFDYRVRVKVGGWKWIANYGKVVAYDAQGKPLRMIGTHKDISHRKRTETALRESVDRERAIAEVIQHMRQTLDLETIFGATTEELRRVLKCDRVLVYRFNPDWSGAVVAESVGSGWISVIETLTDNDSPLNSQALERDRCIIKAWDSQEAKSNDTYIQDTQGSIYRQGTKHSRVTDIYQANFDPCYINFLETFQARAYLTVPIFSNQKLWGLLASYQNSSPRAWHESEIQISGQISTQLGIAIQQAELFAQIQQQSNELQRAKEAAEVANRAKSIFLANMSHELRTPLNVILGFTQVMNHDASLPPEQQEHVKIIHRSGEHLLTLINDVLDLSKIEADRITFDQSNFDVIALLRSLWEMLRLKAETKGLQLNLDIADDVPQYITTDPNKLRQVLINLLSNAIKFTETGSVTLRVSVGAWERERDTASPHPPIPPHPTPHTLLFAVEDTGIGITAADLETIFDAFMQAQAGKVLTDGTGLGLTISRRFVQLMGGDLTGSSTLGQGSTFRFSIPIQIVNAAEVPLPKTQQRILGLVPGQPLYRILVVDDQPENRQLLVKFLTQLGLEVRQACDGEEAIALTAQWHPHLVWMDIRMPKVDGYEATQTIRATPEGQEIAIIALTAQASRSARTLALSAGCNDYLSKPFKENELFTKMAEHLGLRYVYEDQQERGADQPLALTPDALNVMPSDWLAALQQAAQHCDDEEVSHLIEQIPQDYSTLSAGLDRLAHDFQFKQIVQLIQASSNNISE
ncbi:MAG: PAS domain S-box protein [Tildeniella nuda ZEHNDER 1965/U140]|nr:PAS domain S-box protein [Tildeniella nuda ZEHNDER 1965/U140]